MASPLVISSSYAGCDGLLGRHPSSSFLGAALAAPSRAQTAPARALEVRAQAFGGRFGDKKQPPAFRCLQCQGGCGSAKCNKCGNKDINRFAFAARCSVCLGGRVLQCYKCGGLGEIPKYKGIFNRTEVGSSECGVCKGERAITCGTCQGKGLVYQRSADWR